MMLRALWVALSLSIGWGIRGNFGHEYGAMIPGALASLAGVLVSRRSDWLGRSACFGFLGALGWSFGGSISYMQVIGYTHSGHSSSVLYGSACLFVIGFLWASMGGAGAVLPAFLSRERLAEFFVPLTVVFVGWVVQDLAIAKWFAGDSAFRQNSPLYWYDTNWVAVLVAIGAILLLAAARRRIDFASSLILHMAVGWWMAFLLLVNLLGWRMTPPRGDSWAGCVGMVVGMWIFFQRKKLAGVTAASLISGFIGGFGFATANALKLVGIASGKDTNWHSLLEQSYGFINGIGLAVAIFWAARLAPRIGEEPPLPKWMTAYAAGFLLLVIPYVNFSKNPEVWVKARAMPEMLYGISANAWFALAFLGLAAAFVLVVVVHWQRPGGIGILNVSSTAMAQLIYLILLWTMVIGNFERALPSFAPVRLVTEGIIFLNAVLCTMGILVTKMTTVEQLAPGGAVVPVVPWPKLRRKTIAIGTVAGALSIVADWGLIRSIYGDRPAGYASKHIRFGPEATATKAKPPANVPHP
jgi:hypothetical protein